MKKNQSKMKVLEWSKIESTREVTTFLPLYGDVYGDFSDAQGQVTNKSMIESCPISNPSEILWVSLLPARIKKIQSKMKALECSQHYSSIFHTLKGS